MVSTLKKELLYLWLVNPCYFCISNLRLIRLSFTGNGPAGFITKIITSSEHDNSRDKMQDSLSILSGKTFKTFNVYTKTTNI